MTTNEKRIAADLLELAADEFSNHGCNDYEIAATPENIALVRQMFLDDGNDEEDAEPKIDNGKICVVDSSLMRYLCEKLRKECDL